ncbi:MAG: elongation factor G [Clostridiales bacterium]|jgi:elongation factor G|nr:elongation factor G [Clostridiales bacterium]MDD2571830.1 elongation factor G [Eubacteriales bacterium]MCK9349834.1 elongation factor G [Clostridiales bacterium]MDD3417942.1 elongation factor G [Eubacteriales bacterium]MDD3540843.1 elongation factor G [Eubacteriales bacterium]
MNLTTDKIRNITVMGHGGVGKTAFVEAALYNAGVIDRMGRSNEGNTVTDFDAEEIRRGVSVSTSVAWCEWKKHKINFIDTPGDFDFLGEQLLGMYAGDTALIVMSAKDGLSVGAEKAVRNAAGVNIPVSFFINRMDEPNANFEKTLGDLRDVYGQRVLPLALPILEGEKMTGLVDVMGGKAYAFSGKRGEMKAIDLPSDLEALVEEYGEQIKEQIAENDEHLMEKYFEGEAFTPDEESEGMRKAITAGSIMPVLVGSAQENLGISFALDLVTRYMPTPVDGHPVTAVKEDGEKILLHSESEGPLAAFIFKTFVDPFVGRISLFRVFSGTFKDEGTIYNVNQEKEERLIGLNFQNGKKQQPTEVVVAGDIGAIAKLSETKTLDTLTTKAEPLRIEGPEMPVPCLTLAIAPVNKGEEEKIMQGLVRLQDEDVTFTIVNDAETRQFRLSGLGEVQLDVISARLKSKFGVEAVLSEPRIAYRETIRKKVKVQGRHKKQTGGHGQYGDVWIVFEPGTEEGLEFAEEVFGGSVPKNYFPAVEKGLQEAIVEGVLAGYPIVNLKATLVDGSYHDVDSNELSFKLAARLAYRAGLPQADPVLLEPIDKLYVHIPDDFLGDIMGDLNKRRGRIHGINADSIPGFQVVEAEAPRAEIAKYATDLKSMTQGRGWFTVEFVRYEQVPQNIADRIIAAAQSEE